MQVSAMLCTISLHRYSLHYKNKVRWPILKGISTRTRIKLLSISHLKLHLINSIWEEAVDRTSTTSFLIWVVSVDLLPRLRASLLALISMRAANFLTRSPTTTSKIQVLKISALLIFEKKTGFRNMVNHLKFCI